jgi:Family of unknown function (DUF6445)
VVDLDGKLRLHPQFKISIIRLGAEHEPVLVVDHFLDNPQVLADYAAAQGGFSGVSDAFYPGQRAPIPAIYCFALRAFLGGTIAKVFGLEHIAIRGELSHFSLVTTPPDRLQRVQRLPHFDNTDPKQLAVLHYLCPPEHGGTSFYRHRRTRFEFIDEARKRAYADALAADLQALGEPPARYICGDDAMFERIQSFDAAFNRVLVYRSVNLHSADIGANFNFDANPKSGRLTANTFFYYR